jgi:hypothetical protein
VSALREGRHARRQFEAWLHHTSAGNLDRAAYHAGRYNRLSSRRGVELAEDSNGWRVLQLDVERDRYSVSQGADDVPDAWVHAYAEHGRTRRARFWTYHDGRWSDAGEDGRGRGYVRLSVASHAPVTVLAGGPTEEGYSYRRRLFELARGGELVQMQVDGSSRCCDGRVDWASDYVADAADLEHVDTPDPDVRVPRWAELGSGRQRDYAAEREGY